MTKEENLDPDLQKIIEEGLLSGIKWAEAKGGAAFMIDPLSGKILGHGQYHPTKKNFLSEGLEPGSTFKLLNYAIMLKANETLIADRKEPFFFPEKEISEHLSIQVKDLMPRKALNLSSAIQTSSNKYAILFVDRMIQMMGAAWYTNQLREIFGIGIEPGFLPTPGKFYRNGTPQWSKWSSQALALGYHVVVTCEQMTRAYAIFTNGGYRFKNGQKQRVLSENICHTLVEAMKLVVKEGGTSILAHIPGYHAAGKSGTTRKQIPTGYSTRHHFASFIGFAPVTQPAFILMSLLDEPSRRLTKDGYMNSGGVSTAWIFKEISCNTLNHLKIPTNYAL